MEEKMVKLIREKSNPKSDTLRLENTCLLKITPQMGAAIAEIPKLVTLSLTSCKLVNLKGLGSLASLQTLDLSENNLSDLAMKEFLTRAGSTLKRLSLAGNKIAAVDTFSALKESSLRQLDVMGCPLAEQKDYRARLFELVESLRVVDGEDREARTVSVFDSEEEAEEAQAEEGTDEAELQGFIEKDLEKEKGPIEEGASEVIKRVSNDFGDNRPNDCERPTAKVNTGA